MEFNGYEETNNRMTGLGRLGPDFDDFVRQSSSELLRLGVLLTGDRGRAEDLLQVALVRTARRWSGARHNPAAYTRRVLVNLVKDDWRNRARRPREVADLSGIHPPADGPESAAAHREAVTALMARLPLGQRKVLALRYFLDLSVEEVAVVLDCTEGTVKSQTSRALQALRKLMAADAALQEADEHAYR